MRAETADIVFLDPPFNLGKDYGVHSELEELDEASYYRYMCDVIQESHRVMRPGGAVFLYHLPYWASRLSVVMMQQLSFRHWVAISMKNGFARGQRLYPAHYALLYLTKGLPGVFSRPKLRPAKCRHCGGLVKSYGGYTPIIESQGINLSDVWDDLSPVRHKERKYRTANQLPQLLTDRVVEIAGRAGGVLVDPFVGTGTSLVSAHQFGMQFVANDLSRENVAISKQRVEGSKSRRRSSQVEAPHACGVDC